MRADALAEMSRKLPVGNVLDSGYGMFRECLRYKLERQGKRLISISRYEPTTRTCSVCGSVRDQIPLRVKAWTCPQCGAVHHKEINAAKNIKAQGLAQYFGEQNLDMSA